MQVNIKIRDSIYKKLKEVAKKEQRTITAQLDIILCNALETTEEDLTNISIEHNRTPIERKEDIYSKWN